MEKNYNKNLFLTLLFLLIVLATNNYFSYENSLIYGGSDGRFYTLISKYSPNFGIDIEYIKGERFFFPYLLGIISKITAFDLHLLYQATSIIFVILIIILYQKILILSKVEGLSYYFSIFLVLFNPYLIRYYLAVPTLIVDLGFIISLEIIALGFIQKKKNNFFLGLVIATFSRQNSIIILFVFFIIKFFFKKKSIFKYKDLFLLTLCYIGVFFINTYYATNSTSSLQEVENLYSITLFGILIIDYNLIDLFRYLYFPILGFGPLIVFIFILLFLKKFNLNNKEFIIFCWIISILIIGIALVGGPTVTGKNLIRLSNLSYIYLLIIINANFVLPKSEKNNLIIGFVFSGLLFLWSLHPTFSKIQLWQFTSAYFNF